VARYGGFSFLDGQGHFEGLLASGGYVQARLLPAGLDFNGDGHDEQLCLSKFDLFHLDGDATPRVTDPGGPMFFPQVYASTIVHQPGPPGRTVDGSPVILFQALPCGGTPRFVLCVRSPWLAIYDARKKRWVFTWVPPVSIRAAAVTVAGPQRLEVVLSTEGNLLWHLAWNQRLDRLASFAIQSFDAVVTDLAACAGEPDRLLIAAADGLFDLENAAKLTLVARGSYQAVCPWAAQRDTQSILAVTSRGDVQRFDRAAAGTGPR
jgi:hypothetical protein